MESLAHGLLTYLLHSSLLLGLAALLCAALRQRHLALQEAALRAALVGSFLTASLVTGLGLRPLFGTIHLASAAPLPFEEVRREAGDLAAAPLAALPEGEPLAARLPSPAPAAAWRWTSLLPAAWGALALLGLARLASASLGLHRLLRGRSVLSDETLAASVRAAGEVLGLAEGGRVSLAPRLAVPLATGLWRPEVCLPPRALAELGRDEQLALCAHELAHVARRDPAWLLVARLAEALAPLQPLNRWARRRLQDLAECLSDDLAVAATDRAQGLARSLVDVAAWSLSERGLEPAAAVGALSVRSRLGHRVERLMDPLRSLELPRRFVFPAALVVVLAAAFVAPAFSSGAPQPEPTPAAEPAPPADELTPPPAPAARPAPPARPAPVPRPALAAPPAPPAPPAPATPAARHELERLAERLARRAEAHQGEMAGLEAEVEALMSRLRPHEADIERLAEELAERGHDDERAEVLHRELAEKLRLIQLPQAEMRALQEKALALAEAARPSEEELRDLRRLGESVARESAPQARAMARAARDEMRTEMRRAAEEVRRAGEELRRAVEEVRRAAREAARAATRTPDGDQR